jgi:hypothetical protein
MPSGARILGRRARECAAGQPHDGCWSGLLGRLACGDRALVLRTKPRPASRPFGVDRWREKCGETTSFGSRRMAAALGTLSRVCGFAAAARGIDHHLRARP